MTPKDTLYKLRQAEFRALNKVKYRPEECGKDEKGNTILLNPKTIVHKEKYTGVNGR